jgi:uncharacterized protein YqeY
MTLIDQVNQQIAHNLKSGNKLEVDVLRLLKNALDSRIKENGKITPEEEIKILRKEIKIRDEARELYLAHSERIRAEKEEKEAKILKQYLPKELSEEKISKLVDKIIAVNKTTDFGQIMSKTMAEVKGAADGKKVKMIIKNKIQGASR